MEVTGPAPIGGNQPLQPIQPPETVTPSSDIAGAEAADAVDRVEFSPEAQAQVEAGAPVSGTAAVEGISSTGTALPPLAEGEYYHVDLIGLPCTSSTGEALGAIVAVERLGATRFYVTAAGPLSGVSEAPPDAVPDLRLRDLRLSRISSLALGAEDAPVLTLTLSGGGHVVTLECAGDQLGAADAVALVSEFAGRMEQPLRHLL